MLQESRTGYKTIYENGEGEVIEKKSRFIAIAAPVQSEEEATAFVESIRKKYWDARHHCYAYILGEKKEIRRMSDDGEPTGTAGKPILDLIEGGDLTNTIIVVTRYFGGTLLGTGGLVRAYSGAAKEGLKGSVIVEKCPGRLMKIAADYTDIGKIQYILGKNRIPVLDTLYTDRVEVSAMVPGDMAKQAEAEITEGTGGRAVIESGPEEYYGILDGEILRF